MTNQRHNSKDFPLIRAADGVWEVSGTRQDYVTFLVDRVLEALGLKGDEQAKHKVLNVLVDVQIAFEQVEKHQQRDYHPSLAEVLERLSKSLRVAEEEILSDQFEQLSMVERVKARKKRAEIVQTMGLLKRIGGWESGNG